MKDKIKAKLRTKSFWVALAGAAALILSFIGIEEISEPIAKIVEAIGSILVVTGIIASPAKSSDEAEDGEEQVAEENAECGADAAPNENPENGKDN